MYRMQVLFAVNLLISLLLTLLGSIASSSPDAIRSQGYIIETIKVRPKDLLDQLRANEISASDSNLRSSSYFANQPSITVHDELDSIFYTTRRMLGLNSTEDKEYLGLISVSTKAELDMLRNSPFVLSIVPNNEVVASEITENWGLDRIDQAFGMDNEYNPGAELGANVDIYIIDSGVFSAHAEFIDPVTLQSRVLTGYSNQANMPLATEDCNGHGTHVASMAAGNTFGVARKATIIPVRIWGCITVGTSWTILQGFSWTTTSMQNRAKLGRPVVINLSMESLTGINDVLDRGVQTLAALGAFVTVAAGNQNVDACNVSPGRDASVFTVGSLQKDDTKLKSSNFGSCVDMYAPGESLLGAFPILGKTRSMSGTSVAAPLVAGVVATLYERFPDATTEIIRAQLLQMARPITPSYDVDCAGLAPGNAILLQALNSRATSSRLSLPQAVVPAITADDFKWWHPRAVFSALTSISPSSCMKFSASVSANATIGKMGRLSLMLSTIEYQSGVAPLLSSTKPCNARTASFVVFDGTTDPSRLLVRTGDQSTGPVSTVALVPWTQGLVQGSSLDLKVSMTMVTSSTARVAFSVGNAVIVDQVVSVPSGLFGHPLKFSIRGSNIVDDLVLSDITTCSMPTLPTISPTLTPTTSQPSVKSTIRPTARPTTRPTASTRNPTKPPTRRSKAQKRRSKAKG